MANGIPDQQAALNKAQALLTQGAWPDAIQILQSLADNDPNNGMILGLLGKAYFKDENFAAAAQSLAEAFTLTGDARVLNWQGRALRKLGRAAESEECFRQAIALLPNDPAPKINLAVLVADTSPKQALAMLSSFYRDTPDVEILIQIVLICLSQNDSLNAAMALANIPKDQRGKLNISKLEEISIYHNGALDAWIKKYCQESLIFRRQFWNCSSPIWEKVIPSQDCLPSASVFQYSRSNPSPRYNILAEQYSKMHAAAKKTSQESGDFAGTRMNFFYAPLIKEYLRAHGAKSLLDYGGGRGVQYKPTEQPDGSVFPGLAKYYGVETAQCFDAGWPIECPYPAGQYFDAVVSCDVLEHIDEADLPWVIDELFAFARKAIFVAIGSYPAAKTLPNGENAHCTIKPSSWWRPIFAASAQRYPGIHYRVLNVMANDASEFDGFEGVG